MELFGKYLNEEEAEDLRQKKDAIEKARENLQQVLKARSQFERELNAALARKTVNGARLVARALGEAEPEPPPKPFENASQFESPDELRDAITRLGVRQREAEAQVKWAEDQQKAAHLKAIRTAMDRAGAEYADTAEALLDLWKLLDGLNSILIDAGGPMASMIPDQTWRSLQIPGSSRIPSTAKRTEMLMAAFGGETLARGSDYRGTRQVVERIANETLQTAGAWPFNWRIGG